MLAESIQFDLSSVVGVGGTSIGGWLAATLWSAYKRWSAESALRKELMAAQIRDLSRQEDHRAREVDHWAAGAAHRAVEEKHLSDLRREVREVRDALHAPVPLAERETDRIAVPAASG